MSTSNVVVSSYVPPFRATGVTSSITRTASVATRTSTGSYATQTLGGGALDSSSFLRYFTIPYLDAHVLSIPSYRYAYILWFVIAAVLIFWAIMTQVSRGGGNAVGAYFRKLMIRRIAFGGGKKGPEGKRTSTIGPDRVKRKKIWASPTIAQMLAVLGLIGVAVALSIVGDDYISPTTCTFGGVCPYSSVGSSTSPPKTTYRPRSKRAFQALARKARLSARDGVASAQAQQALVAPVSLDKRQFNINGWAPFNDPLLAAPNTNIAKSWWASGNRLGLIAYAMLPLIVSLAVKQWPFNIWATPFLTNYHFDKTAILHRWAGRVIWLFSTAHTAVWSYQLVIDKDPYGRSVYIPMFEYYRFIAGIAAYVFLTLMVICGLNPIRSRHYEWFYWSHVILVFLFLAACIMHFRPLMVWCIVAACLWGAERLTRLILVVYINGPASSKKAKIGRRGEKSGSFELVGVEKGGARGSKDWMHETSTYPPMPYDREDEFIAGPYPAETPRHAQQQQQQQGRAAPQRPPRPTSYYNFGPGQDSGYLRQHGMEDPRRAGPSLQSSTATLPPYSSTRNYNHSPIITPTVDVPPTPGYAKAQLLPGRTVRLTIRTPRAIRWYPGQHVLLNIPSVRALQSHPYTIVNVDERAVGVAPVGGGGSLDSGAGSDVILLIRAQKGFSKRLWDHIVKQRRSEGSGDSEGVELRAYIGWPMGSSCRASWGEYDSLLIVSGGTGITYGMSVLEYVCRRLARREQLARAGQLDAKTKGKHDFRASRIRFVWIMREFAHLSWIAPTLRKCLDMVHPSQLQIDLFVSADAPGSNQRPLYSAGRGYAAASSPSQVLLDRDDLEPPRPAFSRSADKRGSMQSFDFDVSDTEETPGPTQVYQELDENYESVTDLVLFDGEEDVNSPADLHLSKSLRREGKVRRARSRRERGITRPKKQEQSEESRSSPRTPRHPHPADNSSFVSLGLNDDVHGADSYSLGGSESIHRLVYGRSASEFGVDYEEASRILDITDRDREDLEVVAELARPGHPRLDHILDEEIARSAGTTLVACCGPTSMNTIIRHLVSDRIDVKKIMKGDRRGEVSLVAEDFSF